jgi:hypothetical protein
MKLPGLTLSEIEQIPAESRESFLRRCDETDEMRQFRTRAQFLTRAGVLCAAAVPILLGEFAFHWHPAISIAIGVLLTFAALLAFPYFSTLWQLRIIRRLLSRELGGRP